MLINTLPPLKELVPVTARGEATRKKLLASAAIEFGGKGFPAASVSSITQRADVGQGTFYLYFHSKEEVFATLVREIAAAHCKSIAALANESTEEDIERRLVTLLSGFAVEEAGRHRILREAQYVDAPVFRETQEMIFAGIAEVLVAGRSHSAEPTLRAAALVGAAEHAALLQVGWNAKSINKTFLDAVLGA